MIKFEDLKIVDRIVMLIIDPAEVVAIGPNYVLLEFIKKMRTHVIRRIEWFDTDWSYYTPPKQKKVRLMSPAVCFDWIGPYVENRLFMNSEEAKNYYSKFYSWPARDSNGNAIKYAVEVAE